MTHLSKTLTTSHVNKAPYYWVKHLLWSSIHNVQLSHNNVALLPVEQAEIFTHYNIQHAQPPASLSTVHQCQFSKISQLLGRSDFRCLQLWNCHNFLVKRNPKSTPFHPLSHQANKNQNKAITKPFVNWQRVNSNETWLELGCYSQAKFAG